MREDLRWSSVGVRKQVYPFKLPSCRHSYCTQGRKGLYAFLMNGEEQILKADRRLKSGPLLHRPIARSPFPP